MGLSLSNSYIWKLLEATGMEHCNGFPTPTKVQSPLGKYYSGPQDKIDLPNSYKYSIGMMFYL